MDWLDVLAVQGTLKSLLQHHSSKASILCSAFFIVQLSHPYMTTGKTIALTRRTFVGKVMSLHFNSCLPGPFFNEFSWHWASLIAQLVKNPPAMQETLVPIPGLRRSPGEGIGYPLQYSWASLVVQWVKNPSTIREIWVRSLGWEDPLEKGKTTHSSILA